MEFKLSDGAYLHVRSLNQGNEESATILLHGWGVSGNIWKTVLEHWPESAGPLIVPDLRGSGWSAKPRTGYSMERYAQDVRELIEGLRLKNVVLVGHSMGGAVAQLVAAEMRTIISKLILISPVPASGVPLPPESVEFFRSGAGYYEQFSQIVRSSMALSPRNDLMASFLSDGASVCAEAYLEGLDSWRNASFEEKLRNISAETVIVAGEAEPYLPEKFLLERVVSKIKAARFQSIPKSGHYPQIETPEEFEKILLELLARPVKAAA